MEKRLTKTGNSLALVLDRELLDKTGISADTVLDETTPPVSTVAVCRDHMVRFDERWLAVEDLDWWLRVSQHTDVTTVPKIGLLIRLHDEPRINNDAADRVRENLELLEHHAGYFTRHRTATAFRF